MIELHVFTSRASILFPPGGPHEEKAQPQCQPAGTHRSPATLFDRPGPPQHPQDYRVKIAPCAIALSDQMQLN
jgi:hypothetical protein